MNKLKLMIFPFLFIFTGCIYQTPLRENEVIVGGRQIPFKIDKFKFEGHDYLMLNDDSSLGRSGIEHDPNCPCFKNKTSAEIDL
jgi:hypothetical protein